VLQERELSRVGGRISIPIDIRLVAATNVNLQEAVRTGRFREDLYYRLNVAQLHLPPLRKRIGDILPLALHFVEIYKDHLGLEHAEITDSARRALASYPWPGNIRELENVIHHAMLVMRNGRIDTQDLHLARFSIHESETDENVAPDISNSHAQLEQALLKIFDGNGKNIFADIESRVVQCAYEYCQRNQLQTARLLGISRNILRHRLKLYGML
jgi:sigma-54-specific transcriptional regulator